MGSPYLCICKFELLAGFNLAVAKVDRQIFWLYSMQRSSTWFTYRKPQACGSVYHIQTNTEWYKWHVPWATWSWQHIYSLATTVLVIRLECIPSNNSNHHSSVVNWVWHQTSMTVSRCCYLSNSSIIHKHLQPQYNRHYIEKGWPQSCCLSIST